MALFLSAGCKKTVEVINSIQPPPTVECTSVLPNKLSAKFGELVWCADQTCFGDQAIIMTINGINSNGSSLTIELDDFSPGTYPINQDQNHVLFINAYGFAYESTNNYAGTLVISSNDTIANLIKGRINTSLISPVYGSTTLSEGSFSIYYTE